MHRFCAFHCGIRVAVNMWTVCGYDQDHKGLFNWCYCRLQTSMQCLCFYLPHSKYMRRINYGRPNIEQAIIFLPCGFFFYLLSIFFSSPNLSRRRLDVYHTYTWCGLSANLRCRSETCCTRLAKSTGRKKSPKLRHRVTIAQICPAISWQVRHVSTIGTRRPASADRTARRQFQATSQPVSRTQASDAMTSQLPRYESKCVQCRCFQCGSVPLRADIKGTKLPPANILIPLERQLIALRLCRWQFLYNVDFCIG